MATETGVLLFFTLFQVVAAIALLQRRAGPHFPVRVLAGLLVLNATLSGVRALHAEGVGSGALGFFGAVVDLPSGFLIAAFAFSRAQAAWGRSAARASLVAGALHVLLGATVPWFLEPLGYALVFALPYHAAVAYLVWSCARGEAWERWVALAFLPRALYFATQGVVAFLGDPAPLELLVHGWVLLTVVVMVPAVLRLARTGPPGVAIVVPTVALGPTVALAQMLFPAPHSLHTAITILDFFTLAFVRPLYQAVGLTPRAVRPILERAAIAGIVALLVMYGAAAVLAFPGASAALLGLASGLLAVAVLEAVRGTAEPGEEPEATPSVGAAPGAEGEEPPTDGRPQWQRILVELRGSSARESDGLASARFTQKEIARVTGISVKRVSEFPQALNASAAVRLDAHVPGWRDEVRGSPVLVEVFKGAVRGSQGAWVYYRLTPLGERLAAAVAAEPVGVLQSSAADSGRIPRPP